MANDPTVTVNLAELEQTLKLLGTRSRNLIPWFRGYLRPDLTALIIRQFQTWGEVFGKPWKALSPTTVAMRSRMVNGQLKPKAGRARAGVYAPLRDTLKLYAAYTKPSGPGGLEVVTGDSYTRGVQGSMVPYAALHATGYPSKVFGRATGKNVPARPVVPNKDMPTPPAITARWEAALATYLRDGVINLVGE